MKIALLGATGFVGSAILNEAMQRGHSVTAVVRDTEKLKTRLATRRKDGRPK
jgi:putative NADH-flavin reductase